jgi:hypothetical protein
MHRSGLEFDERYGPLNGATQMLTLHGDAAAFAGALLHVVVVRPSCSARLLAPRCIAPACRCISQSLSVVN